MGRLMMALTFSLCFQQVKPAVIIDKKLIIINRREAKMIIKGSSVLRNNYPEISRLAKDSQEPIYITNNGEGEGVYMSLDAFEKREEMLNMRARILQTEEERLSGAETSSVFEAREALRKRLNGE
ncbi:MAG: type II toxin-antitoxin system Phd/YefM family antitoxin [Galactobacillus timonensis]|uniref:type II toxin-antitoxin system Phd/YefM family antitoxin n=1 Tax=Galactobacillus timonensis TaxID=2041840 RepID=UPI0023F3144D|nr:type II toxin-antitoxin system Phd/YefM family antitoxin [Galactobacillus timonensis]MCI6067413.1 type II toxin-antitoxin system Phd/YefM family antitoxin [Galactobacillus timonensis]